MIMHPSEPFAVGLHSEKGDTVQPQSQWQIPTGNALRNDGKYGLHQEKDRAQFEQESQNIQAGRFFPKRQHKQQYHCIQI